jgi:hypothetical protein
LQHSLKDLGTTGRAGGEMSLTFAYIAGSCAALLFLSFVSIPLDTRIEWLKGLVIFWLRSILLWATLATALLAVVLMFLK